MTSTAFTFRLWITGFVAVILFVLAIYQSVEILRKRRFGFVNTVTVTAFLVVLSLTILVDPVSRLLDTITGFNNLSWFLGYTVGVLACYYVGYMACRVNLHPHSTIMIKILTVGVGCMIVLMSVFYVRVLVHTPEWIPRTPRSLTEVIFSTLFFGYGGVVSSFCVIAGRIAIRTERNAAIRLRLRVTNWAVVAATLFFTAKVLYLWSIRFFAEVEWLNQMALLCMAINGMLWVMVFMPTWAYRWAVTYNPVAYIRRLLTLYELMRLQQLLHHLLTPADNLLQEHLWRRITQTNVCIYRTIIAILDYKRLLASQITSADREHTVGQRVTWSVEQRQQAQQLHELLQAIDTVHSQEIEPVVQALSVLSRYIRQANESINTFPTKISPISSKQNF